MKLESESPNGVILAMTVLEQSAEQEAHEAEVNGGLIEPTKEAPSVKDDIVINNNDTDDIVEIQEWNSRQEPVDGDDITPEEPEVLDTVTNDVGQRHFTQLADNYTAG